MPDQTTDQTTDVDLTEDIDRDSNGNPVSVHLLGKWTSHVVKRAVAESALYVLHEVDRRDMERQVIEDNRANHRNLNRMLTLLGALLIGLGLTWLLQNPQLLMSVGVPAHLIKVAAPYTFVITIFLDSSLAAYSFFRKY